MRRARLGIVAAALVSMAGRCGPLPPPVVTPPATMQVDFDVVDGRTGLPVPAAAVRYWFSGPSPDTAITQTTDARGTTTFSIPASVHSSHVWASADGYVSIEQHVDAWPGMVVRLALAPRGPPPPSQLRIVNGGFADATGPALPVYCHFGDAFAAYLEQPAAVVAQLSVVKQAGYRGIRVWTTLMFWWWAPYHAPLSETQTPDYWPRLRAFFVAMRDVGLTLVLSQGDVDGIVDRLGFMRRLGAAVNETGVVVDIVDAGNEAWGTGEPDWNALAEMVSAFREVCPGPLLTLTSPQGEDKAGLDAYSIPPADAYDVHGSRSGHWWDKTRHIFSVAYEVRPTKRLGIQSEPTGPGELVSVTEHKEELTDDTLAAMAVMSLLARQAWVYMSGHGVVWRGPLEDQPGFYSVPKAVALLPADITSWPLLFHGGERWAAERLFAAHGEMRWDHALSGDGRFAALGYGPDDVTADQPVRAVTIEVDRAFGPHVRLVVGRLK